MVGASTLAIVVSVVQLLIMFLKTPLVGQLFTKLTDDLKIILVTGLTVVGGVSSLMLTEQLPFVAALIHSTTVAALSVFAHQLYKHLVKKDE